MSCIMLMAHTSRWQRLDNRHGPVESRLELRRGHWLGERGRKRPASFLVRAFLHSRAPGTGRLIGASCEPNEGSVLGPECVFRFKG